MPKIRNKWLLLVALVWCACATAQTSNAADRFRFDSWTTDNGLPQVSVNSILQTRDGFLWLTTYGGLVRYDGLRFQIYNSGNTKGLRTSRFKDLFEDKDGSLWISTEGQGVVRHKDGLFASYTTAEGLPDNEIRRLDGDASGNLLLTVGDRLLQWSGTSFVTSPSSVGHTTDILQRMASGAVWDREGTRLRKFEGGRVTAELTPGFAVRRLFEDRQGRVWLAAEGSDELLLYREGRLTSQRVGDGQPQFRFLSAFEDRRGRVWFGTHHGLLLYEGGNLTRYTTAEGLTRGDVGPIYEDREGTIWVGTTGGLSRVTDRAINTYSLQDGLAAENVYPIYEDRGGRIWIGSWPGLTVYENGKFQDVGTRYGVAADSVSSLHEDRDGNLWIGCWSGKVVRVTSGKSTIFTPSAALGLRVRAIYQDRAGVVWFGSAAGLVKLEGETFTPYLFGAGVAGREVFSIYEDRKGQLWLGTDAGLIRYGDGVFTPVAATDGDGSAIGIVRAIHEDDDGALWIGTYDSGLYRLREGRFTRYTTNEGLFDNGAFQIVEDGRGNFWISCNLGIYRVRKEELDGYAEGRAQKITSVPYNKRDGMLNSECNGGAQPAGVRASDGRLWFPTQQGVAVINPELVPFNGQPPLIVIESLVVDAVAMGAPASVTLQSGQTYFEVHYSGLSFINPELVKFKYRLAGLDDAWVDAGTRRVAYYTHLPPGKYLFTVLAANRDGVWNEQGAWLEIIVRPPLWRTWWFLTLATGILILAVFALYRWRIRQLQRAHTARETFARQLIESQENERRRIASELHDSLGQSLVLIKNWALLGLRAAGAQKGKSPAHVNLDQISTTATEAIKEVREIAYNLGPYQLDRLGLSRTIEEMVGRVASSSPIHFNIDIDPLDGLFSKQTEINVFRIVQEAVSNIIKHSAATGSSLSIKADGARVSLTISDDGQGFTPATADGSDADGERPRGFGLLSLQERVRLLGGVLAIKSEPGRGTDIHITLPREHERNGR